MAEYNSNGTVESSFHYVSGFQEERVLGRGKFEPAVLFQTPDKNCLQVVLKFICGKTILDSEEEEDILGNISAIGKVCHQNVVAYQGLWLHQERKQIGIKMEYLCDGSLHNLMERGVIVPWSVNESILRDIAAGMEYLHSVTNDKPEILHANLHLNNVLLTGDFRAKVSDYGLKLVYSLTRNHAQTQQAFEDYKFRAPERMKDATDPNTKATDIYSFGIIVYAVLKRLTDPLAPMKEDEVSRTLIKGQSVVDPDRLPSDRPDVLVDVLLRATEFNPDHRMHFEDLHHTLDHVNREQHGQDIETLKRALLDSPMQPHVPPLEEEFDMPPLKPVSNHASPSTWGCSNSNISSRVYTSQTSQQPTDEIDGADGEIENEDRKKYNYDPTTPENCASSRRGVYSSSSSTSGESVLYPPPTTEPADIGDNEDNVGLGSSQASSGVALPPSDVSDVGALTDMMRSFGIQPHPSCLNQGIHNGTPIIQNATQAGGAIPRHTINGAVQNGTASIPNLPNFHDQPGGAFLGQGGQAAGQQFTSPSNSIPAFQSFINGIPAMKNGKGPQIVNVSDESVVVFSQNAKISVVGKPKGGKKPLPPTDEEKRILESTRPVTERDLEIVAKHLGKKWRELGRTLKFSKGQLDAFSEDYQGLQESIYQMLLQWKQRDSTKATVGRLAQELDGINRRSIVRKLTA